MRFARIQGIFYRYLYILIKGPQQLSDLFYWPLIDILLWGLASVWIGSQHIGTEFPLMLMTGLILWQTAWRGSVDVSVSLMQEFWHRNLINLFSTPLRLSEWSLGVMLLSLCKLVITVSFGAIAVHLLYSLNVLSIGWHFFPAAALLVVFGWTLGFISSCFIIYYGHQLESIAWMMGYLFAPFSAVFYPVSILPLWAQKVAWALPSTYLFEGMRMLIRGEAFPAHYYWASLGLDALYLTGAIALFHHMFQRSRVKGLARLE
jgi:ABC-2 type transport system permease protein